MPDRYGKISIDHTVPTTSVAAEVKKNVTPQSPKSPKTKKRLSSRRKNGVFIWLVVVTIIFITYNVLGFYGVPYYLTSTLSENFKKKTGMVFDPGDISFNPLTFHFSSTNAKLLSESGSPLATLQTLSADLAPFSLLRMDLVCNSVMLSELTLNITREQDGSYNFAKFFHQKEEGSSSEILNFSDLPFLFSLNNIAIKNGKVLFLDLPTGKTHTIEEIKLDLPTFSNFPFQTSQYLRPSFSAVINGSPVELTGQALMGDSTKETTTLTCNLHAIDLPVYAEYLPLNLPLALTSGKADGKINLQFDPASQQEDKLSIDFELQLRDAELQTTDETVFVSAPATLVKGKLKPVAKTIVFSSITTNEPTVHSVGDSFLLSVSTLFKKEKKGPQSNSASGIFSLAIDNLSVKDGTFSLWKDRGEKKPERVWKDLQLNVNNYSSTEPAEDKKGLGSFLLSGNKGGSFSSFTWQGDLSSTEKLRGTVTIDQFDFMELLHSIGSDKNLSAKGLAELKGQLTVSFPQDSGSTIGYTLADAELVVQDFQLMEDKLPVLSAPTLKFTSFGTAYKTIQFGSVSLQNGLILLPDNRIPEIFKQFAVGKYLVQDIDFTGQLSIISMKNSETRTTWSDISLKALDLDTPEKAKDNFTLSTKSPTGGTIQGQGDVRISPFSLTINTEFNELSATEVFPFMTDSQLLNNLTGILAGKGSLSLPKKSFAGDLQLSKASIRKSADPIFSWTDMLLQGVNFTSEPFHLGIAATIVDQPKFSWQISASDPGPMQQLSFFFQHHLPPLEAEPPSEEKTKAKKVNSSIDIQEIQLNQANISIKDNRTKPKWKGSVTDFSGKIKDIRLTNPATNSAFSFTGKLQDAPFAIVGEVDIFAKEQNGKFHLTLDNYPLASFNTQLAPLTDVDTKSGFFDLRLDCSAKASEYQNTGFFMFSGVKPVSEKSDSALALALLTGPDDKFRFDFDFTRTAPPGKTIFIEEILSLFHLLAVKASVSPLLLASGDYSDLIGAELAEFEPGQSILTTKGKEILARYSSLLSTHPHLGLELSGGIDRDVDTPAMKEHLHALEIQRVEMENKKRFEAWQKEKLLFDQKVAEQQKKQPAQGRVLDNTIPPAVLKEYIPKQAKQVVIDDAMLLELAKKRSQSLSQYLTEQLLIQPERLIITPLKKIATITTQSGLPTNGIKITLTAIN